MPDLIWNRVQLTLTDALTLAEGLDEAELMATRLTRQEVRRHLLRAVEDLRRSTARDRAAMPELGWESWADCASDLERAHGEAQDRALWSCVASLVPHTLSWLRIYRSQLPHLFAD